MRWSKVLIGAVLLWRALCIVAVANSADLGDSRVLGELSSPGLSRSAKLVFATYDNEAPAVGIPRAG